MTTDPNTGNQPSENLGQADGGTETPEEPWRILIVEDDPEARRQVKEYFAKRKLEGRSIAFREVQDWDEAVQAIREHKADLVILDIYRGQAAPGGERVGEDVLTEVQKSAFVPVILYTNLPEGLEAITNRFVRLVPKTDGLPRLQQEIQLVFQTKIPQMHRAILDHIDSVLCTYMWDFVVKNWQQLEPLSDKPEFLRLLLRRLALSFMTEDRVEVAIRKVFTTLAAGAPAQDVVHPAEFYIKPPLSPDPVLGDIRIRVAGEATVYLVVLWPTCDMVSRGRSPKADRVLCAKASPLGSFAEFSGYVNSPSNTSLKKLEALLTNNRQSQFGQGERFHFLPGVLDIPDLVVDFQELESMPLQEVKGLPCLGSLTSPYAEQMSSRFDRYRGRIGTPDLNCDVVIGRAIPPTPKTATPSSQPDPEKKKP